MNCQQRHQKLNDVKGNFHYVEDGERRRARSNSDLREALGRGALVVFVPSGSPAPTDAQLSGRVTLPRGGRVVSVRDPALVGARPNQAKRGVSADLLAKGASEGDLALVSTAAKGLAVEEGLDAKAVNERRLLSVLEGARTSSDPGATLRAVSAHLERVAEVFSDGVGVDAAVEVLTEAARGGAPLVEVCAAKLLWSRGVSAKAVVTRDEVLAGLANDEFDVVFQPVYSLSGRERVVTGAEALVRWTRKQGDFVPPPGFVPAAEDAITELVVRRAAEEARAWKDAGNPAWVSGNVPVSLLGENTHLADAAQAAGAKRAQLTLEVTETEEVEDPVAARAALEALRSAGTKVKMDDYGTGNSTIAGRRHLLGLIDVVKVDRELVKDVNTGADPLQQEVLKVAIRVMADKDLVVEGIENRDELKVVEGLREVEVQGFLFSKPLSAAEMRVALKGTKEA
jgi:EAL domain-containing protein (putative c-di-GMP-specific phosphodiesterase class I)